MNKVLGKLTSDWAEYISQSTSRLGEYSFWLPNFILSQIEFSVHLQIRRIEFLITLLPIKANIVLSLLPLRMHTVHSHLISNWARYSSHFKFNRIYFSVYNHIWRITFLVTLPRIEPNIFLYLLPNQVNTVFGYLTSVWDEYSSQSTSTSSKYSSWTPCFQLSII